MQFSYIIIDSAQYAQTLVAKMGQHDDFQLVATCTNAENGVNKILELKPAVVFVCVDKNDPVQLGESFGIINEISSFLDDLPFVVMIAPEKDLAYNAYQKGFGGFLLNPLDDNDLRKCLYRYVKNHRNVENEKICIRSHGDYHFLKSNDIVYLKADNNTTDFFLKSGKIVTAYKTLKHFENILPCCFFRIHHSYIINIRHVSRINMGKGNCYLLNNEVVLSFSRTYKENIDIIINQIA